MPVFMANLEKETKKKRERVKYGGGSGLCLYPDSNQYITNTVWFLYIYTPTYNKLLLIECS